MAPGLAPLPGPLRAPALAALLALALSGCTKKSTDWTYPDFTGDGLPETADSDHYDPQREADTSNGSADSGDTAGSDFPTFDLVDGVFAYENYYGYLFGVVVLATEAVSCHDALTTYVDGVVYYLLPATDDAGAAVWVAEYPSCGDSPCVYAGYWEQGSDFGYVSGDFSLDAYSDHYVTVTFSNEIDADTLMFYNCGDAGSWDY